MEYFQQVDDGAVAWGGPAHMSAWEGLMWRAETDRRTRSTGILLELLDGEPSWEQFSEFVAQAAARIPRLRDRVVEPPIPVVQPVWAPAPEFDVNDHIRHVEIPAPGTQRQLMDQCGVEWDHLLDRTKPPWEFILFTGLDGGSASAVGLHVHHSIADGTGLIQLLRLAHTGVGARVPAAVTPPAEAGLPADGAGVLVDAARTALNPANMVKAVASGVDFTLNRASKPLESLGDMSAYTRSLMHMLDAPKGSDSPIMSNRGWGHRLSTIDVPLKDLKAAGAAAGGSLNDAFLSAVLGAVRRYHEMAKVAAPERAVVSMPVSLRKPGDPPGGNRFAGIRFPAACAEGDAAARMLDVRDHVLRARDEPAIGFLDQLSPVLTRLPTPLIIELSANLTSSSDVQVSNIRGLTEQVGIGEARVRATYPLGPRPGVTMMVTMITYCGTCCIGINADPRTFPDTDLFDRAIAEGFAEVLALKEKQ